MSIPFPLPRIGRWVAALAMLPMVLLAGVSGADTTLVGQQAPRFGDIQKLLSEAREDAPTTGPVILLFTRENDSHSRRALEQLTTLKKRNGDLFRQAHVVVFQSLMGRQSPLLRDEIPEGFVYHADEGDRLLSEYRVIATPTAFVLSESGKVLGFHPGYSPGLALAIQRDLLLEIQGRTEVRTPAPPMSSEHVMARRLAERGMKERALVYYRQAAEREDATPEILLEMTRLLVELEEWEQALEVLENLGDEEEAVRLRQEIEKLKGD